MFRTPTSSTDGVAAGRRWQPASLAQRLAAVAVAALLLSAGLTVAPVTAHAAGARSWQAERLQHLHWRQQLRESHPPESRRPALPAPPGDTLQLDLGARVLFYADGVFLEHRDGRHVPVRPPQGTIVPYLPPGQRVLFHDGRRYHAFAGVLYLWDRARNAFVVVADVHDDPTWAGVHDASSIAPQSLHAARRH